jgi:HEPN domain-containing protein
MSPDAERWLDFARADLAAARLLAAEPTVPGRLACFHAHQASEKAIKSVLVQTSTPFRRTHDLLVIAQLAPQDLDLASVTARLLTLIPWAVDGRYPGDLPDATAAETAQCVSAAESIVSIVEQWAGHLPR